MLQRRRGLSASPQEDTRDAYEVLGVQKNVSGEDLTAIYKSLAREHHPDRHQGEARAAAELRFQEISEAYQLLSDPVARTRYDKEMKEAKTAAAKAEAASKFRAATWNSKVPDVRERLKNAEAAKPEASNHLLVGGLAFLTFNFVMVFNFLAG